MAPHSGCSCCGDALPWEWWPKRDQRGGRAELLSVWTVLQQQSAPWMDPSDTSHLSRPLIYPAIQGHPDRLHRLGWGEESLAPPGERNAGDTQQGACFLICLLATVA